MEAKYERHGGSPAILAAPKPHERHSTGETSMCRLLVQTKLEAIPD